MGHDYTPLGQYIVDLCERQNLSWREASMRSNLAPETISKILRRDGRSTPRPDTLQLLADGLGGDFTKMMLLAGHLQPPPDTSGADPAMKAKAAELVDLWHRIEELSPERARQIMSIAFIQAEMALAASRADNIEHSESADEPITENHSNVV